MIAMCLIRPEPVYRREAFVSGLKNTGYTLVSSGKPSSKEDLLVIWNRYGGSEVMANTWEQHGGTVLVCENGYIGKDQENRQLYAISAHGHNGSGWWPQGAEDRFAMLGIEPQPWKSNSEGHFLVCGQRGIGTKLMASPNDWHNAAAARIRKLTNKTVRVRLHPGNKPATTTLESDLDKAYACVVWSSSSGVKALVLGYPVFYDAPYWICSDAAMQIKSAGDAAMVDDVARLKALRKMAWAQWTVKEIESGEPFMRFLSAIRGTAVPA